MSPYNCPVENGITLLWRLVRILQRCTVMATRSVAPNTLLE